MKGKSTHLINVPETSTNSTDFQPDYFNQHGDPVYAHMVDVKEINHKKHLIQFPISVDFKKVRNLMEYSTKCPIVLLKANTGAEINVPETSTNSTDFQPDYFNQHGDPVYAHMVDVKEINHKKHLIQFPISVDFKKVRNLMEYSTKCPIVLLKANTGADVNLMNLNTFDTLVQDRTVLEPTSLRMEAYGNNTGVEVLGKFHAFLRWKDRVYR